MKLHRLDSNNGHFYQVGEKEYPSSTTILHKAYPLEPGLKMFLQNNSKEEATKVMEGAGLSGTKVHHAIDLMLQGSNLLPTGFTDEDIDNTGLTDNILIKYLREPFNKKEDYALRGFMNWCQKFNPIPIKTEMIVWSDEYQYAGTLDFLGYIHNPDKQLVIIDWKTGKGLYKEYDLQLASYWGALGECQGLDWKTDAYLVQLGINKCGFKMVQLKDLKSNLEEFYNIKKTFDFLYPGYKPSIYEYADEYAVKINQDLVKQELTKFKL